MLDMGCASGIFYQVPSNLFGLSFDFFWMGKGSWRFWCTGCRDSNGQGEEEFSFLDQLAQMFSVDLPGSLSSELLASTMSEWKEYWMFPRLWRV